MKDLMIRLFGASWEMTILGYVGGVIVIVQGMLASGTAFPTNAQGWAQFIGGIVLGLMGQQAKSKDVSNAPHPLAVSQPVETTKAGVVIAPNPDAPDAATKP